MQLLRGLLGQRSALVVVPAAIDDDLLYVLLEAHLTAEENRVPCPGPRRHTGVNISPHCSLPRHSVLDRPFRLRSAFALVQS